MLILDVERICKEKGISNPSVWLRGLGFHSKMVTLLMRRQSRRLDYRHLEKICLALHCTPDDLFAWQPDADGAVAANHPLQALVRVGKPDIQTLLRDIPSHKMDALRELMIKMSADGEG